MPSLGQLYNDKEAGLTTRKTYNVPLSSIYAEEGFNVRELNQAHVEEFRDAFIAGEYIPPLAVEVTERGVKVIDGHHRYHGALLAVGMGHEIVRLECKDFVGTEADKIAFMITSSQGLALTPLERGVAYTRLQNQGFSNAEIAKKVKRSESDIIQHLQLNECTPYIKSLVRSGSLNYALAIDISREHGVYADREVARLMKKAEDAGKKKITKAIAKPQFNAGKARRALELLFGADEYETDGKIYLCIPTAVKAELFSILQEYRQETRPQYTTSPPESKEEQSQEQLEEGPSLLKADIINNCGVHVWACAAAAFGDKPEFTFNESRFAQSWASDSFEKPESVIVPQEIIYKAEVFATRYLDELELRRWISEKTELTDGAEHFQSVYERLNDVAQEAMGSPDTPIVNMTDFINMMEGISCENWENLRLLRAAVKKALDAILDQHATE